MVYESLVKPYNPIINYVTKFSGITPQILKDVGTRLEDVQAAIREIMPPDVILIGHSLNLDLHALKVRTIYSLKFLTFFSNINTSNTQRVQYRRVIVNPWG